MHTASSVDTAFSELTQQSPDFIVRAPGRINIIGEHTDYNEGLVLPGAIDKALHFAVRVTQQPKLRFWALDINESAEISLLESIQQTDQLWLNYLLGIAQQFQQLDHELIGLDVVFGGNLPVGAGVSSSAALECGMAMTWNKVLDAKLNRTELAQLAQRSSHQFVGIPCGIMDQFASLNGVEHHAILLDCRDLQFSEIPVAVEGCEWVLLNSKVSHNLVGSAYSQRVAECAEAVMILQRFYPYIKSLRDVHPEQLVQHQKEFPPKVFQRARYIIGEHYRTLAMIEALQVGDATKIGHLLNLTQLGLAEDYEVSCPEIDFLFGLALQNPDVYGARIMGGGFGGCTLNLVKQSALDEFVSVSLAAYEEAFGIHGDYLVVSLRDGVQVL